MAKARGRRSTDVPDFEYLFEFLLVVGRGRDDDGPVEKVEGEAVRWRVRGAANFCYPSERMIGHCVKSFYFLLRISYNTWNGTFTIHIFLHWPWHIQNYFMMLVTYQESDDRWSSVKKYLLSWLENKCKIKPVSCHDDHRRHVVFQGAVEEGETLDVEHVDFVNKEDARSYLSLALFPPFRNLRVDLVSNLKMKTY